MFLLRAAFWLSIVILLLPAGPGEDAPRVTVIQAIVAARATIADLSAFCDRNPDVCVTGSAAFHLFAEKAENGMRMIYRYLGDDAADGTEAGTGTLTEEDLLPAWHGPAADRSA